MCKFNFKTFPGENFANNRLANRDEFGYSSCMISSPDPQKPVKAVGLLSGGLDSILAAKIIKDLGVEVHGVYFAMPWGCCDKDKALGAASQLGIDCVVLQLDERYLEIVKSPKHGYGSAMNPCMDCRVHMFGRAGQYMRSIGADFVFTGEVLGQRPMSQMRHSMRLIEKESQLQGRLVRPLCAQHLDPTIPEQEGLIDRNKLLDLSGRTRRPQMDLAAQHQITDFLPPAGGCLLTDKNFARRMKDTLDHGYRTFRETIGLQWGRHFRYSNEFKIVLGRDEEENESLRSYAHIDDFILELPDKKGPTLILKGNNPDDELLGLCAGMVQQFSSYKDLPEKEVDCWKAGEPGEIRRIKALKIPDEQIEKMKI